MREPRLMQPQCPFAVASRVDRREFLKGATTAVIGAGVAFAARRAGAVMTVGQAASHTTASAPDPRWPRRPLLRENPVDSLHARTLAKPVYETQIIDDMERDGNWTPSQAVEMTYTTEQARAGSRSLRFKVALRSEGYIRANRLPDGSFNGAALYIDVPPFAASMHLRFDAPQDWSRFNRISLWCYVHPDGQPLHPLCLQFLSLGAPAGPSEPVAMHFVQDLRPGAWNRLVWEIPEFRRDRVAEFVIFQPMIGLPRATGSGTAIYDFDLLQVERVEAEPYEGWGIAPGKIAYNHVGYLPSAEKVALTGEGPEGEFEVVDAATGRAVARYPAHAMESQRGRFRVLDFTALTCPGRYQLRYGAVQTRPFPISDDLWYEVIEKSLNYFYGSRCGFAVPGVHDACHLDMRASHGGQIKAFAGGWHDAGNLCQGSYRTGLCAYAMLQIYEQLRERSMRPHLQARALEEARWGLEWLLQTRFGSGWRVTDSAYTLYTDNKIGTLDDIVVPARNVPFESFLFAAVAARAARAFQEVDPDFASQLLSAAEEDFGQAAGARSSPPQETPGGQAHSLVWKDEVAYRALAAVELLRTARKEAYAGEAVRSGRWLLALQEQRFVDGIPITGYFYEDPSRSRIMHEYHTSFEESALLALQALCEAFPHHADWAEWYGAVLLHSEFFYRRGSAITEPYRAVPSAVWRRGDLENLIQTAAASLQRSLAFSGGEFRPTPAIPSPVTPETLRRSLTQMFEAGTSLGGNYRLRAFPIWPDQFFHGNTNIQLTVTAALTSAAHLRNRPEIESLARRQLQWVFGGNPFSQSLMYGAGYDYQRHFAVALPNLVGALPVGMNSLHRDAPYWGAVNQFTYKELWVVPGGRLLYDLAYAAMPARVSGSAPEGATLREVRTGRSRRVKGNFSVNLSPGEYVITYGGLEKRLPVLAGGRYDLRLHPRNALEMDLAARPVDDGRVQITAKVRGTGTHQIHLRLFNGSLPPGNVGEGTSSPAPVELTLIPGSEHVLTWEVRIADPQKPWIAVAVPDGRIGEKQEVFGTSGTERSL